MATRILREWNSGVTLSKSVDRDLFGLSLNWWTLTPSIIWTTYFCYQDRNKNSGNAYLGRFLSRIWNSETLLFVAKNGPNSPLIILSSPFFRRTESSLGACQFHSSWRDIFFFVQVAALLGLGVTTVVFQRCLCVTQPSCHRIFRACDVLDVYLGTGPTTHPPNSFHTYQGEGGFLTGSRNAVKFCNNASIKSKFKHYSRILVKGYQNNIRNKICQRVDLILIWYYIKVAIISAYITKFLYLN